MFLLNVGNLVWKGGTEKKNKRERERERENVKNCTAVHVQPTFTFNFLSFLFLTSFSSLRVVAARPFQNEKLNFSSLSKYTDDIYTSTHS